MSTHASPALLAAQIVPAAAEALAGLLASADIALLQDWFRHLGYVDLAELNWFDEIELRRHWQSVLRERATCAVGGGTCAVGGGTSGDSHEYLSHEAQRILRMIAPDIQAVFTQRLACWSQACGPVDTATPHSAAQHATLLNQALWLRVADPLRFALVEQIQAEQHRRLRDGARFSLRGGDAWTWDSARQAVLAADITRCLGLDEPCRVIEANHGGLQHFVVELHGLHGPVWDQPPSAQDQPPSAQDPIVVGMIVNPATREIEVLDVDGAFGLILARALSRAGLGRDDVRVHHPSLHPLLSLAEPYPAGHDWRIERIRVIELTAAIGHSAHRLTLSLGADADPLQVTRDALGIQHPLLSHHWLAGIRLEITVVDVQGETHREVLEVRSPHYHNLLYLNPWVRQAAETILEQHAVFGRRVPASHTLAVFRAALRLLETDGDIIQGDALARLELPIVRLEALGWLQRWGWSDELDLNPGGTPCRVAVQRGLDAGAYVDPTTGEHCRVPLYLLRCYRRDAAVLRRVLVAALGDDLQPAGTSDGLLLGEMVIDQQRVPVYVASRLWQPDTLRAVDEALRAYRDRVGIVLTTSSQGPTFIGQHVVLAIESLLLPGDEVQLDRGRLSVEFRQRQGLAMGEQQVVLSRSEDGHSATLRISGKPPFSVTSRQQMLILERLVKAHQRGNPAVATKDLVSDTALASPQQAFQPRSPWREYLETVPGAKAWRLRVG